MANQQTGRGSRGGNEKARDIMTPNPQTVTERESLDRVAKMMRDGDCGALPVVQAEGNRKIIGMVTDRDIVVRIVAEGKNPSDASVRDAMTNEMHCVREDDPIDRAFDVMSEHQVRRVPVINQNDEIVGIIAQADLATHTNQDRKLANTVENISEGSRENRTSH